MNGSFKLEMINILNNENGYLLMVVTVIALILAIIFGAILPQLHTGQHVRAMTNLNEFRANEAAMKGINAVKLGVEDADNFQELIGYTITNANTTAKTFTISGKYAYLFLPESYFQVYYSSNNDGQYEIASVSEGASDTTITVNPAYKDLADNAADGVICRSRGILWAINQLCGATTTATNHDEYTDEDGDVQFVSGCQGIDLTGNDDGKLQIAILVSRNGAIRYPSSDSNLKNDCLYFYNNGIQGAATGSPFLSEDNEPSGGITWTNYDDAVAGVRYCDFDLGLNGASNYQSVADFKYDYNNITPNTWFFSVGSNGTWRGQYPSGTELWTIQKDFSGGDAPFRGKVGKDNDGDGDIDNDDNVEVFIIARSTGITVAPGSTYTSGPDKTDLMLIHDANTHLPNPAPQVLEAAFYVASK